MRCLSAWVSGVAGAIALAVQLECSAVTFQGQNGRAWVEGGGSIVRVRSYDKSGHFFDYAYPLTAKLGVVGLKAEIRRFGPLLGVDILLGDGKVIPLHESQFGDFKAAPAEPVTIQVSNDADALDIACDGTTAVAVGANSATPVSLLDLDSQREVATVAYPNKLARAVAIDDAGTQAIVVIDDPIVSTAGTVRRVTIAGGAIADSGEQLSFNGEYVWRVYLAPGGKVGAVIVGSGATRLVSFSVPGLVMKGSVNLAGGVGNAVAFSPAGDRVYVRSGQRAAKDVIESFAFDSNTGAIGQTAILRIDAVSGFTGVGFQTSMAISWDGATLIAADENTVGALPAPRIASFSTATGALTDSIELAANAKPQIVATPRLCPEPAVEYYHAGFDHYFVTAILDEIAKLDNGTIVGWTRTGRQFNVYPSGSAGAATCRFFSATFAPKSSHFYTPYAPECATVKASPAWQFEDEVFNVVLPAGDGSCPPTTVPLYRVYNNGQGGAPNHRYTTQTAVRTQMIGQGWVPEGMGIGVIACVPP